MNEQRLARQPVCKQHNVHNTERHMKHVNTHIDGIFSESKCNETSTVKNNMLI